MKKYTYIVLVTTFLLAACSGKTKTSLKHLSPNGKVSINIEGHRAASIESWKVDMKVKAYDFKEGKLTFEIYAEDLTDKNVSFDWKDDKNCIISLKEQDGKDRKFQLIASPEQLQMGEIQ